MNILIKLFCLQISKQNLFAIIPIYSVHIRDGAQFETFNISQYADINETLAK